MGAGRLGWIRLRRSSQDGFPNRIEALDWAIETNPFTPMIHKDNKWFDSAKVRQ